MFASRDPYRMLTSAGVLMVAVIAATISFEHISSLSLKYGQQTLTAYLMPLSVDGLVTVSSLAMLRSARAGLSAPVLARSGLFLGILATLGANVASGLSHGPIGAVIAGWPAIAFVISAEIAVTMVRRKPSRVAVTRAESAAMTKPATVTAESAGHVTKPGTVTAESAGHVTAAGDNPADANRAVKARRQDELALSALVSKPDMSYAELAAILGQSERTARRVMSRLAGHEILSQVVSSNGSSNAA